MENQKSLASVLSTWKGLIYRIAGVAVVTSVIVSLLLPKWYVAKTTCLPPQEGSNRGGMLQMISGLGLDFWASGLRSQTPATDTSIGVLKSRNLREQIVDQFDLQTVYKSKTRNHAIKEIGEHLWVTTDAEGMIEVRVEDKDKTRAADMANALVEYLDIFNRRSSVEQAQRTHISIQGILIERRRLLEQAAEKLRRFQEDHWAIELTEQTRVTVEAIADLQSERTKVEIAKGILSDYANPNQIQMKTLNAKLREIRHRLDRLENGDSLKTAEPSRNPGVLLPLSRIPSLGLQLADLTRDVMIQEQVYQFLASQLEEARIQEARDLQTVQILDRAVPPIKKVRPKRGLIVILTTCLALLIAVSLSIAAEGFLAYTAKHRSHTSSVASREFRALLVFFLWLKKWGGVTDGPSATSAKD